MRRVSRAPWDAEAPARGDTLGVRMTTSTLATVVRCTEVDGMAACRLVKIVRLLLPASRVVSAVDTVEARTSRGTPIHPWRMAMLQRALLSRAPSRITPQLSTTQITEIRIRFFLVSYGLTGSSEMMM